MLKGMASNQGVKDEGKMLHATLFQFLSNA